VRDRAGRRICLGLYPLSLSVQELTMGIEHAQEARFAGFVERLCKLLGAFRGLYRFAEAHPVIFAHLPLRAGSRRPCGPG
jgi:hypothetical protein